METAKLRLAELNEDALQILLDAEASINESVSAQGDPPDEILLIALHNKQ